MCLGGGDQKTYKPAAEPAPPEQPPEEPNIGQTTQDQNKTNFGSIDGPSYRFRGSGSEGQARK